MAIQRGFSVASSRARVWSIIGEQNGPDGSHASECGRKRLGNGAGGGRWEWLSGSGRGRSGVGLGPAVDAVATAGVEGFAGLHAGVGVHVIRGHVVQGDGDGAAFAFDGP